MSNKENWKIPHLDIRKGQWYVCTQDWSDDGWLKFAAGEVVQAVEDDTFLDCYGIKKHFGKDGICYFRPADKDEIPAEARLKDINLTEFERKLDDYNICGETFICKHDDIEIKHEVRRIATELLEIARRQLAPEIRREVRCEMEQSLPRWKHFGNGIAGGTDRDTYLIRSSRGYYFTSNALGMECYYLELDSLEQLPGLPQTVKDG